MRRAIIIRSTTIFSGRAVKLLLHVAAVVKIGNGTTAFVTIPVVATRRFDAAMIGSVSYKDSWQTDLRIIAVAILFAHCVGLRRKAFFRPTSNRSVGAAHKARIHVCWIQNPRRIFALIEIGIASTRALIHWNSGSVVIENFERTPTGRSSCQKANRNSQAQSRRFGHSHAKTIAATDSLRRTHFRMSTPSDCDMSD